MIQTARTLIEIAKSVLAETAPTVEVHCIGEGWIQISEICEYGDADIWLLKPTAAVGQTIYIGANQITAVRQTMPRDFKLTI